MGAMTKIRGESPDPGAEAGAAPGPIAALGPGPDVDDAAFARVAALLRAARGLDLSAYKDRCVRRRIAVRARARGCADGGAYARLLEEDPAEVGRLYAALTITVSQFFRNASTFARIETAVLPALFERAGTAGVRIWSVGCAGGEEPYSLAILLLERFREQLARTRVSIQGLDIDEAALERARAAVYDRDRLAELPRPFLARYFTQTPAGRYQLAREIRRMVLFRRANVLAPGDLPPGPVDLILCRNVLIYFARSEQERLLAAFETCLAPGGFLVLGKAETLVAADRRRFKTVCPWERIYRRP